MALKTVFQLACLTQPRRLIEEVINKLIAYQALGAITLHTIGDGALLEVSVEVDFGLVI